MDPGLVVVSVVGPLACALVLVVAAQASAGRIRRNHAVGIRLPSTLESDASWSAGHRAAVGPAAVSTVLLIVADALALLLTRSGVADDPLIAGPTVLLLAAVAWIAVAAHRAAMHATPSS